MRRRPRGGLGASPPRDLAADSILMVDAWLKALPERDRGSLLWVGRDEVQALRAALERLSQREDVIARLDREVEGHIELVVETQRSRDAALARERELREVVRELLKAGSHVGLCDNEDTDDACSLHLVAYAERKALAEALLDQPAAGEKSERG